MLARRVTALTLALAVTTTSLLTLLARPASAVEWVTKQIPWSGPGAAGFVAGGGFIDSTGRIVAGGKDSLFITDEADTQRTVIVSTSDWDWTSGVPYGTVATIVDLAIVTVVAQLNNGAADSLYGQIEKCDAYGNCMTTAGSGAAFVTPSFFLPAFATFGAGKIVFRGVIGADPLGSGVAPTTLWLDPAFRLKFVGDVGGTTPKLSGCRAYITYPKKTRP